MKKFLKKHGKTALLYLKTEVWTCMTVWLVSDIMLAVLKSNESFYTFVYALSKVSSTTYACGIMITFLIRLSGVIDENGGERE